MMWETTVHAHEGIILDDPHLKTATWGPIIGNQSGEIFVYSVKEVFPMKGTFFTAMVSCLLLTGCDTGAISHTQGTNGVIPNAVLVTRNYGSEQVTFSLDAAIAKQLYGDIKHLIKPVSGGPISCPADFGLTYEMKFTSNGNIVIDAHVSASGCEFISYGGKTFWASTSFWRDLGGDLQMSDSVLHGYAFEPGTQIRPLPKFEPLSHPTRIIVEKNGAQKVILDKAVVDSIVAKINQEMSESQPSIKCNVMTKDWSVIIVYESGGHVRVFENHGGTCQGLLDDKSGRILSGSILSDKKLM
ncbi:hypothetical protein [Sulfoacidibacillus thermotolerans]|nr:hypothetical protein [Sulfoacidibacillus thermotolerans]